MILEKIERFYNCDEYSFKLSYENLKEHYTGIHPVYEDAYIGIEYCFMNEEYLIYDKRDMIIDDDGEECYKYTITKNKPDCVPNIYGEEDDDDDDDDFMVELYRKSLIYHDIIMYLEYSYNEVKYKIGMWNSNDYDTSPASNIHEAITIFYKILNECNYTEYLIIKEENEEFMELLNELC